MRKSIKKTVRKNLFSIISISLAFIALLILFFTTDGIDGIGILIQSLQPWWLIASFACVIFSWVSEALIIQSYASAIYQKVNFFHCLYVAILGTFYSAITPFATGGQPMQIYAMNRMGMDAGAAGSIITVRSIMHSTIFTVYTLILVLINVPFFIAHVSNFVLLAIIGFIINFAVSLGMFIFGFNEKLALKITSFIIRILTKLKFIKTERLKERIEDQIRLFSSSVKLVSKKPKAQLFGIGSILLQCTFSFLVTYCLYRSFGLNNASPITISAAQSFVQMVSYYIPLPGGSGGAEGGFLLFFKFFFPEGTLTSVMLLWRLLTYYFAILVGGIVIGIVSRKVDKKNKKASSFQLSNPIDTLENEEKNQE